MSAEHRGTERRGRHRLVLAVGTALGMAAARRVLRALLATRTARRHPDDRPVTGSLDTWPAVPRSPGGPRSVD